MTDHTANDNPMTTAVKSQMEAEDQQYQKGHRDGYAAALRDVLSAMRHRYDDVIDTDNLIRWAAERGIDLEDAP